MYVLTLFHVVQTSTSYTRLIASVYLFAYIASNLLIYTLLYTRLSFTHFFYADPWDGTANSTITAILMWEPMVCIAMSLFRVICACDAWRRCAEKSAKKKKEQTNLPATSTCQPQVAVIMPIYNEPIASLMQAINSVTESKYPSERLHLVLAFDADEISPLFRAVVYCLTSNNPHPDYTILSTQNGLTSLGMSNDASNYAALQNATYRGVFVTICRFPHGGKRHAQKCSFEHLEGIYQGLLVKPLLLFIDSDIELDGEAILEFVEELNRPGGNREALTGLVTCKTKNTFSFWSVLQDTEYIESQMLHRNAEDYLGALTMMRFETLARVAPKYFSSMVATDSFDFSRRHLGEDRYLTHLIMEDAPQKYRIGFCSSARCKTEACLSLVSFLKQRRRWYLGTVTNEIYQLTSAKLWTQYPLLNILSAFAAQNNVPLISIVLLEEQLRSDRVVTTYLYVALAYGPIWLFVILFGFRLNRKKIACFYPLTLIALPVLAAAYQ
ncbi:hypothetical protein HDU98_003477, partial [Podochytrium sp. JEL0797]